MSNVEPEEWALRILVLGLWIAELGFVTRCLGASSATLRHSGRFLWDISISVCMLAGIYAWLSRSRRAAPNTQWLPFHVFLTLCGVATVIGAAYANPIFWMVMAGFLPFGAVLCVPLAAIDALLERLVRVFIYQSYVSFALITYVLLIVRPFGHAEWWGLEGAGAAQTASQSFYFYPFLFPFLDRIKTRHVYVIIAAYIEHIVLQVVGLNRGLLINVALAFPLLFVAIQLKTRGSFRGILVALKPAVLGLMMVIPAAYAVTMMDSDGANWLTRSYEAATSRMAGEQDYDQMGDWSLAVVNTSGTELFGTQSRGGEARDFLEQQDIADLVVGHGFGGGWYSRYWGSLTFQPGVHLGPAHLILVGGLPFMLAFFYLLGSAAWRAYNALGEHPAAASVLCYIFIFLCTFLPSENLEDTPALPMLWLCAGMGLALKPAAVRVTRKPVFAQLHYGRARRV